MFCEKCGKERIADEAICKWCGNPFAKVEDTLNPSRSMDTKDQGLLGKHDEIEESVQNPELTSETSSLKKFGNITINGNELQWMYEFSFWRNPTILITVSKVLLISLLVPAIFMFFITLNDGFSKAVEVTGMILGYGIILMVILLAIAYPLLTLRYGGKYCVLFKMDDNGVNHIQLDKQYKKAQALGFLTTLIGLSAGNFTTSGSGLMAATKQSMYTSFKKVKSIKVVKYRNTIYVNESLLKNQVYASNEDFDFVLAHLVKRCPKNVRIKSK